MKQRLKTGFARLWKSPAFWLTAAVFAGFSLVSLWNGRSAAPEQLVFGAMPPALFLCPVFVCLFQEEDRGTRPETADFLCTAIVCSCGAVLLTVLNALLLLLAGRFLLGPALLSGARLLYGVLCCGLAVLPVAVLCVLIDLLLRRRAAAAALAMTLMVFSLLGGSFLDGRLSQPARQPGGFLLNEDGSAESIEGAPNPRYVGGNKRVLMELAYDLLPGGPLLQAGQMELARAGRWPVLSLAETGALAGIGAILLQKRKNKHFREK